MNCIASYVKLNSNPLHYLGGNTSKRASTSSLHDAHQTLLAWVGMLCHCLNCRGNVHVYDLRRLYLSLCSWPICVVGHEWLCTSALQERRSVVGWLIILPFSTFRAALLYLLMPTSHIPSDLPSMWLTLVSAESGLYCVGMAHGQAKWTCVTPHCSWIIFSTLSVATSL